MCVLQIRKSVTLLENFCILPCCVVVASMWIQGFTMVNSDSEQVDDFETISDSEKYTAYCTDRGLIYWL